MNKHIALCMSGFVPFCRRQQNDKKNKPPQLRGGGGYSINRFAIAGGSPCFFKSAPPWADGQTLE